MLPSPVPLVNFAGPVAVTAGPYDYGLGGARMMAQPVIAGGSDDAATLPVRESAVSARGRQVRTGTLLMILSDLMFVAATYLAFVYLSGLNTQGQFHPKKEAAPTTAGTLLVMVAAIVAAAVYTWSRRGGRSDTRRARTGLMAAWGLSLVALVGNLALFAGLGYHAPLHAYASSVALFVVYHSIHLLVALVVGALLIGRLRSGRLAGRSDVLDAAGYWFWWVAISAVGMTLVLLVAR